MNLVPNRSEMWRRQRKFNWIVIIKISAISLPSQPFLGRYLGFYIFFHNGGWTLFFTAGLFLDYLIIYYLFIYLFIVLGSQHSW